MQNLDHLRHSCAHLLAAAVIKLWPEAKPTIGPSIENGFYYDFDFGSTKISETDLPKIEQEMKTLVKEWKSFDRIEVSNEEAKKQFKDDPYKLELIEELIKKKEPITFYKSGEFVDLCRGGHIDHPNNRVKHFKLLSIAGAYWRGDEKNTMLTRIYGTCFPTVKELEQYLWQMEEAKKRDHKKLGKELDLFLISDEVGPGLLIWTPKGATIRRQIEKLIISEQIKRGYQHVNTPHIGKKSLWVTSGHWDLYRDKMYAPMKIDDTEYLVKPMNCPMHMMVYKNKQHSYRDLPVRIAEDATVYRYEQTGELAGMTRVRHITQDDSHIFCTKEQVKEEFIGVLDYTKFLLDKFNITDYSFRLSLRDPANKNKYLGDDKIWEEAENAIEKAIQSTHVPYDKKEGEAAFYGPKLDVMIKDALGRNWQCGTIQIDFMLPERFNLEYIDENGEVKRPALIHRAPLGSLERFVGLLIEHYAGKFPVWLAPVQIELIPISDRHQEYAKLVKQALLKREIRVELDNRSETMQAKIRDATLQKIPFTAIIGDKEVEAAKGKEESDWVVSVRNLDGQNIGPKTLKELLELLV